MVKETEDSLASLAEKIVAEIRSNAAVLSRVSAQPELVVQANDALGAAARAYADAVFDRTGWGNPFTAPPADELEADEATSEPLIRVVQEHLIEVESHTDLQNYLASRHLQHEPSPEDDEWHDEGAIMALLEADGWNPEAYTGSGLAVRDRKWSIETASLEDIAIRAGGDGAN